MKLILSKFDPIKKIIIIYTIPDQNISDEIQENLKKIYEKFKNKDDLEEFHDFGAYLSYLFKIKSAWYPDTKESLILTLFSEEHENTQLFKPVMKECVSELSKMPDLSKILYLNTPHTDSEPYKIFGKVIQSLTRCFFDVSKLHSTYNLGLAEILVLGNKGGGKTTIVDYLLHHKFKPQTSPTLTPKIYKLVYENIDFRVLDVCCDEHIKQVFEEHPIEPGKLPQALVYVIDVSLKGKKQEASVKDFNEWMNYLSKQYPRNKFEKIPILILFNKTDLNPSFIEENYKKLYQLKNDSQISKFNLVSAITGEGLEDSFSWLIKKIKITAKY